MLKNIFKRRKKIYCVRFSIKIGSPLKTQHKAELVSALNAYNAVLKIKRCYVTQNYRLVDIHVVENN